MKTTLRTHSLIAILMMFCLMLSCVNCGVAEPEEPVIDSDEMVTISDAQIPSLLQVGHRFNVGGVIKAEDGIITRIEANVTSQYGTKKFGLTQSPNSSSFNLKDSAIAQKMSFQVLKTGAYVYKLTVSAENDERSCTVDLVNEEFWVIEENPEALKEQRLTLTIENAWSPTFMSKNVMFPLRGIIRSTSIITDVTATIYTPTGNVAMTSTFSPCSQKYSLVQSEVDSGISFGSLPAGNYVYELTATVTNGVDFKTKTLVHQPFEVSPTGKDCYGTDAVME